ncbi:MAG TPA: hypothetical protein VH084_20465 [Mycobacterium sp.]|nr:hypothetical protein [Mycobacterium sp.]
MGEYESVLRGVDDEVHHRVAGQHRPWDLRAAAVTIAGSEDKLIQQANLHR